MKQKSVNHQSNKETLKFNGQFVHACFNLVLKNGNHVHVVKITLASKKPLRFNPMRQPRVFFKTPKCFQERKTFPGDLRR